MDRSLYTPRYPRAFAIPLRDDDEDEVEENAPTSAEPEGESIQNSKLVPNIYKFAAL